MKTLPSALLLLFFVCCISFSMAQHPVFFGLTNGGGPYGAGTVIKFDPATDSEQVAYNFSSFVFDCIRPNGSLTYYAPNGLMYGANITDRTTDSVVAIFSFDPVTFTERICHIFDSIPPDLYYSTTNLIAGPQNGLLYGCFSSYSPNVMGMFYSFDPATDSVRAIFNTRSTPATSGRSLPFDPTYDSARHLFFMFISTDTGNKILSVDPSTGIDSIWCNFPDTVNLNYGTKLVLDPDNGKYYALYDFSSGGNYGGIISFDPVSNQCSVVFNFNRVNGKGPQGNMVYDPIRRLFYGTTINGGLFGNAGVIFSFDPATNAEQVVYNFPDGSPYAGFTFGDLVYDPYDSMYYVLTQGGTNHATAGDIGLGTIFRFNPANNQGATAYNFNAQPDGNSPFNANKLTLYTPHATSITPVAADGQFSIYPVPASTYLYVSGLKKGDQIIVTDMLGRQVSEMVAGHDTEKLDLVSLPSGIYLISTNGTTANRQKFIKE